ncbi:ATP-dependent DNA ligase [Streptomyces sp. NPDC003996]
MHARLVHLQSEPAPPTSVSHETRRSLENDGWRCQIHTATRRVWSRHGTDLSRPFSDVADAAVGLPDAVLDGELVAVFIDGTGVAFERLQSRASRRGADFTVQVALLDILAVGDTDRRPRPYTERRTELLCLVEGGQPPCAVPTCEAAGRPLCASEHSPGWRVWWG